MTNEGGMHMRKFILLFILFSVLSCKTGAKIPHGAQEAELILPPPPDIDYFTGLSVTRESKLGSEYEIGYNQALAALVKNILIYVNNDIDTYLNREQLANYNVSEEDKQKYQSIAKFSISGALACQIFKVSIRKEKFLYTRVAVSKREALEFAKLNTYQNLIKNGNFLFQEALEKFLDEINSEEWKAKKEVEIRKLKEWEYNYIKEGLSQKTKK
ncbi:MAG: hypothetical protein QW041_03595 [Candidatus Pacearchaeota archaeon]